jgi:short-subunit dehydrogenase
MDAPKIEQIIRINLVGVSNTIAAVLPGMRSRGKGHLVAISSLAAFRGLPCQMAYCASKAGLNAFMESLRLDVRGWGIDVTTICPGWTHTPQTSHRYEVRDLMKVDDVAREILRAIDRRARFYAFPRRLVWQIRLLKLLPARVQDYLLLGRIRHLRKTKDCIAPN